MDKQTFRWMLGCTLIVFAVGGLAIVVGVVAPGILFAGETPITRIADYDEWVQKGGNTWLQLSMPKSVRDLCEIHDMDSNKIYATFYIAPEDIDQLGTGYTEIVQQHTPTWPPTTRIFISEEFLCAACDVVQHRLVVDVKTGLAKFNPDNSGAFSWVDDPCSDL